jgi:hypothetical protein
MSMRCTISSARKSGEDDEESYLLGMFDCWQHFSPIDLIDKSLRETLHAALKSLPGRYRAVIVLREKGHLSVGDAAAVLGHTRNIKRRLSRARWRIREVLAGKLGLRSKKRKKCAVAFPHHTALFESRPTVPLARSQGAPKGSAEHPFPDAPPPKWPGFDDVPLPPTVAMELDTDVGILRLFNTLTTFGILLDVTLQELRVEMSCPVDESMIAFCAAGQDRMTRKVETKSPNSCDCPKILV